jgi:hypothetical protein
MRKLSHEPGNIAKIETTSHTVASKRLLSDIRLLIGSAKSHLAQTANAVLVTLYWNIGKQIKTGILGNERAQYGKEIVSTLSKQLTAEYGAGFSAGGSRMSISLKNSIYPNIN